MNLRETAERIIEGIPLSYRDGDQAAGHERTVNWLMDLLANIMADQEKRADELMLECDSLARKLDERGEADTKRLSEFRELWQRGMPNFKTACVEFSFEVAGKIDAIFAAMKEGK